ncbi:MAG: hypothetical protein ACD_28C00143G0007 [uncultured bacterium]|nr:MAG: hypothetical protein ACD_28C00143G0007 [uncultured bacterium]KKT77035.1 MAG: Cob(I)alamin adenosyltransferase [Candidatus Peregrinibacteria bacterium GW2011_GWA2_44_7]
MLYCYTGDGKGKTTAALGLALRAAGYGMKVGILQFMKGTWHTGELDSIAKIPEIDLIQMGKGFYKILDDQWTEEEHQKAANEGLHWLEKQLEKGDYKVIILDELNVAIDLKLLDEAKALELLKKGKEKLHLVITGRNAPGSFLELADLVTEMKAVKHPFEKGRPAEKGLDF